MNSKHGTRYRVLAAALVLLLGIMTALSAAAGTLYVKKKAKLYAEKSTKSEVLLTIPKGVCLSVSGGKNWCHVTYNGTSGYVRRDRLAKKLGSDITLEEVSADEPATPVEPGAQEEVELDVGMRNLDKSHELCEDWSGQIVLGEGGMPVPMLFQKDFREVVCVYNGTKRRVSTSGCGATCLSMLIAYETDFYGQSPYTVFRSACQRGLYRGVGLSQDAMQKIAECFGVVGRWHKMDTEEIIKTLRDGKPIIAHMGTGQFTEGGHYVLLRGLDAQGHVLVNDPNSPENCAKPFDPQVFVDEKRRTDAFFVCDSVDMSRIEALCTPAPTAQIIPTPTPDPQQLQTQQEALAPEETPAITPEP